MSADRLAGHTPGPWIFDHDAGKYSGGSIDFVSIYSGFELAKEMGLS